MTGKRADSPGMWKKGGDSRGAEVSSLAGAEDIHPQPHQPLTLGGETSSEQPSGHKEAAARCVRVSPSCTWERGQRRADRHQGQGLEQSCWARWHTGPCCSGHQKLPAQAEGTHKETHPALQLERRRRRKCTRCFEFRKSQMSISQGIALTHLLSAKGQRDVVHDHQHQCKDTGPQSLPLACSHPHHHGARAQAPAKQLHTPLEHLAGQHHSQCPHSLCHQKAQERSAPGTVWQGEVAEARTKAKPGDSWQRGHSETEGFENCMCWKQGKRRRRRNTGPTGQGTQSLFSGTSKLGVSLEDTTGRQRYQG